MEEDEGKTKTINSRYVIDICNNIISMHHFPKDKSLAEGHKLFLEKMKKRFQHMKELICASQSILMIGNWHESVDSLESFMESFGECYPHAELALMNIRHNHECDKGKIGGQLFQSDDGKFVYDLEINDENEKGGSDFWKGNQAGWSAVLKNIH